MANTPIKYKDRSGNVLFEATPGSGFLHFLYGGNPFGKLGLWLLVKRKFFSVLFGKYMSSVRSKNKIEPFIEKYEIDMEPYVLPDTGFQCFNDFFYRKIKPDFRPIADGVVCPADGRVLAFQHLSDTQQFFVKGQAFSVATFLQNESLAKKYEKGSMLIVRLAPVDYHRYHFPCDGLVSENRIINGFYYSVSPFALQKNMRIFLENQRAYCVQHSEKYGDVLYADVGATLTGSIINTFQPETHQKKGDEKGYFAFGGSTVVLLFEQGKITFADDLLENTNAGLETYLKMGESIGK